MNNTTQYNGVINSEYTSALKKWRIVRDCINDKVEEENSIQQYIVRDAHISDESYNSFSKRAVFVNYTGSTLDVLTGSANYKPYTLTGVDGGDLPESIDYINDNFGSSIGYSDHLKARQREVFSVGRCGVWVNVEGSNQDASQSEQVNASAKIFYAEQIEDWSEAVVNGKKQLNYLKLCESYKVIKRNSDGFGWQIYKVTYELYLDENGLYAFDVDDTGEGAKYTIEPTKGNGDRLDFIPFQFYGAVDNRPDIDISPLFKIARINIGLYNNSANLEQASHLFSVPTATFSLDDDIGGPEGFQKANGLKEGQSPVFGGTAYVGCEIKLAQMSLDNMLVEMMDNKVESMARIGAQMITVGQNETAEAARIRKSSGMANLMDMVENLEQGDTNVINWMMMFNNASGEPDEFDLKMNRVFYDDKIDPQMFNQLYTMYLQGDYPFDDLFNVMQDNGLTEKDDAISYRESLGSDVGGSSINPDMDE